MATAPRERDELPERRRDLDELRFQGTPATHRDDDHLAVAREQTGQMAGDGGLADPLARADHRKCERRALPRCILRRIEAKVGADVRKARGEDVRGEGHPLGGTEHRLVREVDDHLRPLEALDERHAVVEACAQLLASTDQERSDPLVGQRGERVANDRSGVLPVDQGDRPHRFALTSFSIRPVYFSYSSVARSNWMIRSWP